MYPAQCINYPWLAAVHVIHEGRDEHEGKDIDEHKAIGAQADRCAMHLEPDCVLDALMHILQQADYLQGRAIGYGIPILIQKCINFVQLGAYLFRVIRKPGQCIEEQLGDRLQIIRNKLLLLIRQLAIGSEAVIGRIEGRLEDTQQSNDAVTAPEGFPDGENQREDHRNAEQRYIEIEAEFKDEAEIGNYRTEQQHIKSLAIEYGEVFLHGVVVLLIGLEFNNWIDANQVPYQCKSPEGMSAPPGAVAMSQAREYTRSQFYGRYFMQFNKLQRETPIESSVDFALEQSR